ncbi:hypothetical protein Bca52824_017495 [Brassica carinata]|uniref:Uncharacterized protein n=1 Tax=Brassica carinata TaxID=52824 RepID=A0A8X7VM82_BRACI|nr:hypothetical protein Bca52824_017495 [Brassica carinata]
MNPMLNFLLALTAVLAATANAGGRIYDTDGDVIIGGSYYVLPRIWGAAGGGLNLALVTTNVPSLSDRSLQRSTRAFPQLTGGSL